MGHSPEEFFASKKRDQEGAQLTDFDKDIVGGTVRLEIPYRDPVRLRQTVKLIREYCDLMEMWSQRSDVPQRAILTHLAFEARVLNKKIKATGAERQPREAWQR